MFFEILIITKGGVAEWSIAAVLKTVDCNRSVGSNPTASAKELNRVPFNLKINKDMKKVLLFAALAFAAVACTEEAAQVEETTVDTTVVATPIEDDIVGPGHVEAEEGGMVQGPGASDAAK